MDPKRKKIYIILIIVCFGASAAILGWSFLPGQSAQPVPIPSGGTIPVHTPNPATDDGAFEDFSSGYSTPSVFPASDKFDTDGVNSDTFKSLTDYPPVSIEGQIGRDNPFNNYPITPTK